MNRKDMLNVQVNDVQLALDELRQQRTELLKQATTKQVLKESLRTLLPQSVPQCVEAGVAAGVGFVLGTITDSMLIGISPLMAAATINAAENDSGEWKELFSRLKRAKKENNNEQ